MPDKGHILNESVYYVVNTCSRLRFAWTLHLLK